MIIKENNLQKWLFDYFEGNLSAHEKLEVEKFIRNNPRFESEFDAWRKSYSTDRRMPVYMGASALMVETSLLARIKWSKAAIYIGLILGAGLFGYMAWPEDIQEEQLAIAEKEDFQEFSYIEKLPAGDRSGMSMNGGRGVEEAELSTVNNISDENEDPSTNHNVVCVSKPNLGGQYTSSGIAEKAAETSVIVESVENTSIQNQIISEAELRALSVTQATVISARRIDQDEVEVDVPKYQDESKLEDKFDFLNLGDNLNGSASGSGFASTYYYDEASNVKSNSTEKQDKLKPVKDRKLEKNRGAFWKKMQSMELALVNSHDPIFFERNHEPIITNPALVGNIGDRIKSSTMVSGLGTSNEAFKTSGGVDFYSRDLSSGFGIYGANESMGNGLLTNYNLGFAYAKRIELSRYSSLKLGAKFDVTHWDINEHRFDYNTTLELIPGASLTTGGDGFMLDKKSGFMSNLGIAAWYDGERVYGGIHVDNFLPADGPSLNEEGSVFGEARLKAQVGTDYRASEYSGFVLSNTLAVNLSKSCQEISLGSTAKIGYGVVGLGLSLSKVKSAKMLVGVQGNSMRLMYGFGYGETLGESNSMTHTLSLRITPKKKSRL